jgi:hypothetical protein
MSVFLEREFQLGIDRVSDLVNTAYDSLRRNTPWEEEKKITGKSYDIEAIRNDVASLPHDLQALLDNHQLDYYQYLESQNKTGPILIGDDKGYSAQYIYYTEAGWLDSRAALFVVNLSSPSSGLRFEAKNYEGITREFVSQPYTGRMVEITKGAGDGSLIQVVTTGLHVATIKWERSVPGREFVNTRFINLSR